MSIDPGPTTSSGAVGERPAIDPDRGLGSADVAERVARGQVNRVPDPNERSPLQIVRANVVTPVNGIMLTLFALIMAAGFWQDGLFVGVVVSNSVIGIWQEVRARRALRRLEILNTPAARVVRDGAEVEIDVGDVVADDIVELASGDQVAVDGEVVTAAGLTIDESLLTGESDPIDKVEGDEVRSGSYVVAGSGRYRATRVGADSYANALAGEARRFSLVNSELRRGINIILRVLILVIPPASLLLLLALLDAEDTWQRALQGTVAAAVAMVPDGLVLLTSLAFMAGVITLTRRRALAKELATVELLARVDVLCLDKTGTITTGDIGYVEAIPLAERSAESTIEALGAVGAADPHPNPTLAAIAAANPAPSSGWDLVAAEPFSSARKWSAARFAGRGTFYLGAPDILFTDRDVDGRELAAARSAEGRRVLLLSQAPAADEAPLTDELPGDRLAVAVVVLEDTIRPDAEEILRFFDEQGVTLKVISGDNVETVASVAARAGVPRAERRVDARELPTDEDELADVLAETTVFGRVTPHQKQAMVGALQRRNHVVAMTGDGVNDVLALKDADMGIAMGSGSAATRGVAQLVLLDNRFATLPEVLAQGRRVINNIERVSNLFVTKAVYAVLLTAIIGLQQVPFPFLPRHLTLIGSFSIGIPGLFLALAANENLVRAGFLRRVLAFSVPAGLVSGLATWAVYTMARDPDLMPGPELDLGQARTLATLTLLGLGLVVLVVASAPLRPWKVALATGMAAAYGLVIAVPWMRDYFELDVPSAEMLTVGGIAVAIGGLAIVAVPRLVPTLRGS
ncbi:MAG: HAD-IC family P-type ATPase [Actinomycetota bacterium]